MRLAVYTILEEILRGSLSLWLGVWPSALLAGWEVVTTWHGFIPPALTLFRVPQHLALGWLWMRYRFRGGVAAIGIHLAWNLAAGTPFWPLAVGLFGIVYFLITEEVFS